MAVTQTYTGIPPFFFDPSIEANACTCELGPSPCQECKGLATEEPPAPAFVHTRRFDPFAEDESLDTVPTWQKDIDSELCLVFKEAFLANYPPDETAMRILRILGEPTKENIRILALEFFLHWSRFQFRTLNSNEYAMNVAIVADRLATGLARYSPTARLDFEVELSSVCVDRFQLAWHWFVNNTCGQVAPRHRRSLLLRVISILTMLSHLFRAGAIQRQPILRTLGFLSDFIPRHDAIASIYTFLLQLGFSVYANVGIPFIRDIIARLDSHITRLVPSDPVVQLVLALKFLVGEWHKTQFTLSLGRVRR
ncbi:hypothetical protein BV22DRAFT_106013 [Leucogyrophana mollusca]|uniref:Uncharacterized protein n=1 Tax=Leucogyrophana mollusca TaxID=85980 RepID=A0ACB8BW80_9AGAM|nr:hypothetical protein BV22DRAFT_106013 [Leucogyrophana mollusca]